MDDGGCYSTGSCSSRHEETKHDPSLEWRERLLLLPSHPSHPSQQQHQHTSYTVISSVLTESECEDSIDSIWLFLNYTTFGRIQRDDASTWSALRRYHSNGCDCSNSRIFTTKHDNDNDVDDITKNEEEYFFGTNGAGYIFPNLQERLADRIYSKLFGTKELHTSKEGFYFHPLRPSNIDTVNHHHHHHHHHNNNNTTTTQNHPNENHTINVLLYHQSQSITPVPPFIRSMIALDDMELVLLVLSLHRVNANEGPLSSSSSSSSSTTIPTQSTITLQKGDVFLWRTDGSIISIHANTSTTVKTTSTTTNNNNNHNKILSVLYCTMQPATCTPETTLSIKVESYRQRQTGTYRLDIEEWIPYPPQRNANHNITSTNLNANGTQLISTRQYFDTGPPLMTMKVAELYGLVPYQDHVDSDNPLVEENRRQRAIIRGVQFYDNLIIPSQHFMTAPLSSSNDQNEMAHLVHLTTKDPKEMMGQEKYLGGMASSCQQYVYGVPGGARRVLRIRVADGNMDCIGPSYDGKFKWLRGVTVSASTMHHDHRYPSGCCLALPCNAASVLKINPYTNEVYTFGEDVLKNCGSDRWHYHGGNVAASNGWLYAIPANANRVIKINPVTDEVVYIGPIFHSGGQKWFGGITGTDGCIYGIPHNETSVLKIDPTDDSITLMRLANDQPLPTGQWKWHGGLRAGDKIYGFPNNADHVLVINCREGRVYTIDNMILESGRHRIPQDHCYKYLGGATTMDERYAYLFPCDAERVLRIDCQTDDVCHVGPHLLDGANKFQNGFVGRDGCVYGIPQRASGVLRIKPASLLNDDDDDIVEILDGGPELIGVKDKFEGGVLGPDGCIYCIPLRAKTCIKIVPGKAITG